MYYRLIALDMDGTLLNGEKQISLPDRQAIEKAAKAGKYVILNTGRCLAELAEYLPQLPGVRYLNCVSGAMVYDRAEGRALHTNLLNPETVKLLLALAAEEDAMPHLLLETSIVQRDQCSQMDRYQMGIYQEMFLRVAQKWETLAETYEAKPFPVAKVNLYHRDPASRSRTEQRLRESGLPVAMAESERTSLEISARGVDKAAGLGKLCGTLGLSLEECIVVGDAENDRQALQKAGLAVAMGNAEPEIRALADAVVADCDHAGCAQAIETYLLV